MISKIELLTARQCWDFPADGIRLSLLANASVVEAVKQRFGFTNGIVSTPMATFGDVWPSIPPGMVFNYGMFSRGDDETFSGVRFFHIELDRIVVDLSSGTSADAMRFIDEARQFLKSIVTAEGVQAIGDAVNIQHYTEIRFQLDLDPWEHLQDGLTSLWASHSAREGFHLVPSMSALLIPDGERYHGRESGFHGRFLFDRRTNTAEGDPWYFSAAPLSTDQHLAMIEQLGGLLS